MEFKQLAALINEKFKKMQDKQILFISEVSGHQLSELYLSSFKKGDNPVFRDPNSTSHNCNLDKAFIRRYGNIVCLNENYEIETMWDLDIPEDDKYYMPCKKMTELIKGSFIKDLFKETFSELNSLPYEAIKKNQSLYRLGFEKNHKIYTKDEADKFGVVKANEVYTFYHFYADLNKSFVDDSGKSIESIKGNYRDSKEVLFRGLNEIPLDTLLLVKDLINQGSLLDGQTHLFKVEGFIKLKEEFDKVIKKDNWCWLKVNGLAFAKFRNELIGTLCVELAEGKELNEACKTWNKRVDPANYMKAKAPITTKQINEAKKFVEENGYEESFNRRFATLDDIDVSEILHSNVGDGIIKNASVFDKISTTPSTRHKRSEFDKVEEVSIDKFMKDILPGCTSIEAFFENRLEGNLVALTTSPNKDSKKMFKWDNNFSWTFNGNLAGKSQIKENVKNAGGKVDGVLRCSLQWNDDDTIGNVDFDLHCREQNDEIYYSHKVSNYTKGFLDVDMIRPEGIGVENIAWKENIPDGRYTFFVKNFDGGANSGFKVEIEFDGNIFSYFYNQPTSKKQDVTVAVVTVKNGDFSIKHYLPESSSSKEIWGISSENFHKVNLVCLTPNHWGDNNVGNKHYLFMLENCKSNTPLRGFHVENLNNDLLLHRKTMEVLANSTMIEPSIQQLCGIGFNSTVSDTLIVKVKGSHQRMLKIRF